MSKKKACTILAAVVSLCAVISVILAVVSVSCALGQGEDLPIGQIAAAVVTVGCTIMIWWNVRGME